MKMKIKHSTIISKYDKLPISILTTVPDNIDNDSIKGIFQLSHGMAEYKERYLPLMEYLTNNGYVCVINDHRGHGESIFSNEDLGYMFDGGYKAMVEDLKAVSDYIKSQFPNKKLNLYGHSMGSMVVRVYLKKYDKDLNSLIVCGSPSNNPLSIFGKYIAFMLCKIKGGHYRSKFLQKLTFGGFNKKIAGSKRSNSWLSRDEAIVIKYNEDRKCGYKFTVNGFYNLLSLMQDCYSPRNWKVSQPELPILFIAGENDPCITSKKDFLKAVNFIKNRSYKNVNWKLYPLMRHEIHNELGKEEVYQDILKGPLNTQI